jgi:hypothetical protein
MAVLLLVVMFVFVAMLAPKFAAVALAITLLVGFVIKIVTNFVSDDVTLIQCIKAVFFSVLLNIIVNALAGQALSDLGLFGSVIGTVVVFAACTYAFGVSLNITLKSAVIVSAAFWLVTFPAFIWLGVSFFGKAAGTS